MASDPPLSVQTPQIDKGRFVALAGYCGTNDTGIHDASGGLLTGDPQKTMSLMDYGLAARSAITRPGEGEPDKSCGRLDKWHCDACGHEWEQAHDCMLRSCPNCFMKWANLRAQDIADKVAASLTGQRWIVHATISFKGAPNQIFENRARAYGIARRHRIIGGVCISHHQRKQGVDGYLHYHVVGEVDKWYNPGGGRNQNYVFKVIRTINSPTDLHHCVKYILGHCAIRYKTHAITFFGSWCRSLKLEHFEAKELHCCPSCKSPKTGPASAFKYFSQHHRNMMKYITMWDKRIWERDKFEDKTTGRRVGKGVPELRDGLHGDRRRTSLSKLRE